MYRILKIFPTEELLVKKLLLVTCLIFELWYRLPVYSFRAKSRRFITLVIVFLQFLIFYNSICLIKTNDFKACYHSIFLSKFWYLNFLPSTGIGILASRAVSEHVYNSFYLFYIRLPFDWLMSAWWWSADYTGRGGLDDERCAERTAPHHGEVHGECSLLPHRQLSQQDHSCPPVQVIQTLFYVSKSSTKKCFWGLRIFRKNWLIQYGT